MGKEKLYTTKLSACPFCGDKESLTIVEVDYRTHYYVQCWSCNCQGPDDSSVEGAMNCWNSRINY